MKRRTWVAVLFLGLLAGCAGKPQPLESTLAIGDWRRAIELVERNKTPSISEKILRAHGLMLTNQNDEASCVFSALTDRDLQEWDAWTLAFVAVHNDSATAHYLRGDALARFHQWRPAAREFSRALEIKHIDKLALNARGTVESLEGDADSANRDFLSAIDADPQLAEAHASQGFANLQAKRGADGAVDAFDAALKIAPNYALATAGRAYAQMALGHWDKSSVDLQAAAKQSPCAAPRIATHLQEVKNWIDSQIGVVETASDNPGTSIERKVEHDIDSLKQGDIGALSSIARDIARDPSAISQFQNIFRSIEKKDPGYAASIRDRIDSGKSWTDKGSGAETLLNTLESFTAVLGFSKDKVNAGIQIQPKSLIQEQLDKTRIDNSGWSTLQQSTPGSSPAGATTSLDSAHFDRGDWPFVPLFGLAYSKGETE